MRTAVKPPQAFFLAARTNRAAGLVPVFARVPALFHSMLSPRRRPPLPPAGGGRRGESMLRCAIDARPSVGPVVANSFGSVGVLGGPGTAPGRPSIRGGTSQDPQHLLPCTPLASGTPSSRAHPSNARCPHRITRRHNGGSRRPGLPHRSHRGHVLFSFEDRCATLHVGATP